MKEIIEFLSELRFNNNREWFNANKKRYLQCKGRFDAFAEELIRGIREFDDTIGPLTVKDCTYRIYRDVRFSADKSPYKTHFGAFVVPYGKRSGYGGYYFQVGPCNEGYDSGTMLATGNYFCLPHVLRTIREDIVADSGEAFSKAIAEAKGFQIDDSASLKKVPKGFNPDVPYGHLLKLKNFCLVKEPGVDYALQPDLLEETLRLFRTTTPFLRLINRAIAYCNNPN